MNAYVTMPIAEKVWTVLGNSWGDDYGKKEIIVRALYVLKSAGAAFRKHLDGFMRHTGYNPCPANPDMLIKPEVDMDRDRYHSYILCYVKNILVVYHNATTMLNKIDKYFKLNPDSIGDPNMYFGAKLCYHRSKNYVYAWSLSPSKYVREAVNNCVKH